MDVVLGITRLNSNTKDILIMAVACLDVIVGIGPHQIAHRPLVRRLHDAAQILNLVDGVERRREAAMDAEHRRVDHGGETEAVEDVDARLPHGGVKTSSHNCNYTGTAHLPQGGVTAIAQL